MADQPSAQARIAFQPRTQQSTIPDYEPSVPTVLRAVNKRLQSSTYSSLRTIKCEQRRGILILQGVVPTFYEKQLAQETVRHIPGVDKIRNEIDVVHPKLARK